MAPSLPQIGDTAPAFSAKDQSGNLVSLEDFKNTWLILYFYPRDNTPGCTTEAINFTEHQAFFEGLGVKILGVSPDSEKSHCKFIEKHHLTIQLLSDPDHQVAEAYGAWGLKKFMGKESMGILRSTFLIDPTAKIAYVWPKVKVKDHVNEVMSQVKILLSK
ncbi:MAG: thioredoxin-dependent thiol peroxidase [Microcystaceae cyanobacterium]